MSEHGEEKHLAQEPIPEEELVPVDDAVIGRAMRRSLWGLLAIAVVVALGWLVLRPRSEAIATSDVPVEAPRAVERREEPPAVEMREVSRQSGIGFVHENGARGQKLLPETMGSGVAVFDADGDGAQDLLFVSASGWPGDARRGRTALYRNLGNGTFEDSSSAAGIDLDLYGTGVAVGDVDNDGDRDVFLGAVGPNRMLRNEGSRFADVTAEAGVAGASDAWSTSAAFLDVDNDGDLDLFVCNYVVWSPRVDLELDYRLTGVGRAYGPPDNYAGTNAYLYRNRGDGTFEDISAGSGIQVSNPATGSPAGKALALAPLDIDRDGLLDIFVSNDTVRNFLFHNLGDGRFLEQAEILGLAYGRDGAATGAMGADSAHFRNDDEVGIVVANFANEMSSLYASQGDPSLWADEAIVEGIGAPSRRMLSFGLFFFDYDLDGRLDLLQANGHLEEQIGVVDPSQSYEQPLQLFWNAGDQGFVEVDAATSGDLGMSLVGRASAYGDLDGDGDLDVVVSQVGREAQVFRNDQATGHHWIRLRLVGNGTTSNRDAIGATVELESAGVVQRRMVMPTRSYQSQVELPLTFGLGDATLVDRIHVVWPDGTTQDVLVDGVDVALTIRQTS